MLSSNLTPEDWIAGSAPKNAAKTVENPFQPSSGEGKAPSAQDSLFDSLILQESGGKQFDKNGNPLTSKKGAVGRAQVMRNTGPEAAALAGLPWDEDRWRNDADYNTALGRAYFNKQLADFGDPAKALAAYNAGAFAVRSAVKKAELAGRPDAWIDLLPAETRAYVPSVLSKKAGVEASAPQEFYDPKRSSLVAYEPDNSTFFDRVAGGFLKGVDQSQGLAASAAAMINRSMTGEIDNDFQKSAMSFAKQKQQDAAIHSGNAPSMSAVLSGDGSFTHWLGDSLGYLGYQVAESLVTGGAGSLIGKNIGKEAVASVASGMIAKEADRILATEAGKKLAKDEVAKLAAKNVAGELSAGTALFANNLRQEAGGIYQDALEAERKNGRPVDLTKAWIASIGATVVDTAADMAAAKGLLGRGSSSSPTFAGRASTQIPRQMGIQGGTEANQSLIENWGAGEDPFTKKNLIQAADEGAVGMLGGIAPGFGSSIRRAADRPELKPIADKAREGNSPLSKATLEGLNSQPAPTDLPQQKDPSQRLAELEAIGRGTEPQVVRDEDGVNRVVAGVPGRIFTPEEKAEYDQLIALRDATPGAKPEERPQTDSILERASRIEKAISTNNGLSALRQEDSPVDTKQFLNDLALAKSKSSNPAAREQALARLEFAAGWMGVDLSGPVPAAAPGAVWSDEGRAAQASIGQSAVAPAAQQDDISKRVAEIETQIRSSGGMNALRSIGQSGVTEKEFLEALAIAKNPAIDKQNPQLRKRALDSLEMAMQWLREGSMPGVSNKAPNFTFGNNNPTGTSLTVPGSREVGPVGAGQFFDPNVVDVNATQPNAQLPGRRAITGPQAGDVQSAPSDSRGASDASVGFPLLTAANTVSSEEQQTVAPQTAGQSETLALPAPGVSVSQATGNMPRVAIPQDNGSGATAARRKRKAQINQLVQAGFGTVEKRGDKFVLHNVKTDQAVELDGAADVQMARQAIAQVQRSQADTSPNSPANDKTPATEAQIAAGNYAKPSSVVNGITVRYEKPKGSTRSGTDSDGVVWSTTIKHDYGHDDRVVGADGDKLDIFVGDHPSSSKIFVIDQQNQDGSFDEHKVILGARSEDEARQTYLANYESGWTGLGDITELTREQYDAWTADGKVTDPISLGKSDVVTLRDAGNPVKVQLISADEIGKGKRTRSNAYGLTQNDASIISAISAALGIRTAFFRGVTPGFEADGIYTQGNTILMGEQYSRGPLSVFLHEFTHLLENQNPKAYASLMAVVRSRVTDPKGYRADYYGKKYAEQKGDAPLSDDELRELIGDLGGDMMNDAAFWGDVFADIQSKHGKEAQGIIAKLAAFLNDVLQKAIAAIPQKAFGASKFVNDAAEIREAFRAAVSTYMEQNGFQYNGAATDIAKAAQMLAEQQTEAASAQPAEQMTKARWIKAVADHSRLAGPSGVQLSAAANGKLTFLGDPNTSKQGRALLATLQEARKAGATDGEILAAISESKMPAKRGDLVVKNPETGEDIPVKSVEDAAAKYREFVQRTGADREGGMDVYDANTMQVVANVKNDGAAVQVETREQALARSLAQAEQQAAQESNLSNSTAEIDTSSQPVDGIKIRAGKGLIKGKFNADVDGDVVPGGPFDTEAAARAAALEWRAKTAQRAQNAEAEKQRRDAIAQKFRDGKPVTAVEIKSLGLPAGTSDVKDFFGIAADLFGLKSRDIRPIVKDLIRESTTDMGAKREYVATRKALEAVAKSQAEGEQRQSALSDLTDDELQGRLTYISEQAKLNGGWSKAMTEARNDVQREIEGRVKAQPEQEVATPKYEPPSAENVFDDWKSPGKAAEHPDYKPTPRQQAIMDVVAKAIDDGVFYNTDMNARVAKEMGYDGPVEQSRFSTDVYMARNVVEAQRSEANSKKVAQELNLKAGDKLGVLVFNDFKVTSAVVVESVSDSGRSIKIRGKRGAASVTATTTPIVIKYALERAKERGKRKDNYEEFIAARPQPAQESAPAAEAKPEQDESTSSSASLNSRWDAIKAKVANDVQEQDKGQRSYRAFASLVKRIGEPMMDAWGRWSSFIGSTELVDKTGDEVVRWMESQLPMMLGGYVSGIPSAPPGYASLQAAQRAAEAIEGREKSHNEYIDKLEQQVRDVDALGGNPERITQAISAIATAKKEFRLRKQEIQDALKQAEQREKEKLSQEEREEAARFKPADPKELEKKPTPASIDGWSDALYNGDPAWTNGHLVDFVSEPHLKGWDNRLNALRKDAPPVDATRLVPKDNGDNLSLVGVYDSDASGNKGGLVYLESNGELTTLNRNYYRYFASKFKGAEFRSHGPKSPVSVHQDGRMVGLLMGIRFGKDNPTLSDIKAKVKANSQAAESTAATEKAAPSEASTAPYTAQQVAAAYIQAEPAIRGKTWSQITDGKHKTKIRKGLVDLGMSEKDARSLVERATAIHSSQPGATSGGITFMTARDLIDAARERGLVAKPEPEFENGANDAQTSVASEEKSKTASTPIESHNALMDSVLKGSVTPEQFKAGFDNFVNSKDSILAELEAKTKVQLLREGGPYVQMRYANEKKADVVEAVYQQMLGEYVLGESFTYGMGKDSYLNAVRKLVEATDADKLARYVKEREDALKEIKARKEAQIAAIKDPKTLSDFQNVIRAKVKEGMSAREAFLSLTPEQRISFDTLAAESTKDAREARKRSAMSGVKAARQTTGGQIIATKHTRDGYDLFVVQLSDRLSSDDYKAVLASAKKLGGWYSSFRGNGATPGFQFKDLASANAFLALAGGDTTAAKGQVAQRQDAFEDDRSQTAVERLRAMADKLEAQAEEEEGRDRKANTARRARFASAALSAAAADKAKAKTMRNIAQAIENGRAKFLDGVRTKSQVDMLTGIVETAKHNELRAKYESYAEQEKRKGEPPTAETADFAEFPSYSAFRSDLATLGRQLLEVDGTKKLGQRLMAVADDVTDSYLEFAKENLFKVSQFGRGDSIADFSNRDDAERAIKRSGLSGRAIVIQVKRGQNRVILSPSEAIGRGVWEGDGDKRITLSSDFGSELVESIGKRGNKQNKLTVPWQFQNAYDRRKALSRIGIETASEYRSALREFIDLKEQATANRVRKLELEMVGKKNDGLDFFPTSPDVADQMIEAADLSPDMAVLEPSAGMGHLADKIREAGAEPDVIEISPERRELLEEKGYHLAEADDFLGMEPRKFFTYGDVFRAPDGTEGIMRGAGHMGSQRVRLEDEGGNRLGLYDRSELVGVGHRGSWSGYDRIIMNPPFSNRRDAEHVRHAYELLKPGGRIVAIMGEGVFFGQDQKAQQFRDWLDSVNGTSEKLPGGSFMDPSLPVNTGVNARMVVIDKPEPEVGQQADAQKSAARNDQEDASLSDYNRRIESMKELISCLGK